MESESSGRIMAAYTNLYMDSEGGTHKSLSSVPEPQVRLWAKNTDADVRKGVLSYSPSGSSAVLSDLLFSHSADLLSDCLRGIPAQDVTKMFFSGESAEQAPMAKLFQELCPACEAKDGTQETKKKLEAVFCAIGEQNAKTEIGKVAGNIFGENPALVIAYRAGLTILTGGNPNKVLLGIDELVDGVLAPLARQIDWGRPGMGRQP